MALDPDLRRTWLFGPGADPAAHAKMLESGADALIVDLEDFTPPARRPEARGRLDRFVRECQQRQRVAAVRINALETDGLLDLAAAMTARPDVIAYPMSDSAAQMHALDAAMSHWEHQLDLDQGSTEILPVCETALGVIEVRTMATATSRIRCALLGAEDLANDLCAERGADGLELDYARRRFILEARAAGIEPIDAPYTFSDVEGAIREATLSRRLGYRSKSLVLPEHARRLNEVFTPGADEIARAHAIVAGFDAARSRGEDRALVDGLWVEVPTYRNARRLMERARRLGTFPSET